MHRFLIALVTVTLGLVIPAVGAQSQTKAKTQTPQQAKQELDAAKDKLKDVSQDLSKAEKEVEKAEAAHQSALAKIQKARLTATAEQGKQLGLPAAVAQRDAIQRALEAAQTALSKEFRAQADYQAAAKEAEQASARLQTVREDDSLADDKKKALTADLSKVIRRPTELERERIDADANLKDLRLKAADAGRQVATIQAQAQKAAEDSGEVKTALQAERDAAEKAKAAHAEVEKHKKEVAAAQKKAVSESQQYQKAQSQAKPKKTK